MGIATFQHLVTHASLSWNTVVVFLLLGWLAVIKCACVPRALQYRALASSLLHAHIAPRARAPFDLESVCSTRVFCDHF